MESLDEIRKLPPQKRIERLQQMEDERRKEIEEAEDLIRESQREIKETGRRRDMPVDSMAAESFDQLFTEEEKQLLETKRFLQRPHAEKRHSEEKKHGAASSLEDVAAEAPKRKEEGRVVDYQKGMEQGREKSPFEEAYQRRSVTGMDEDEVTAYDALVAKGEKPVADAYRSREGQEAVYRSEAEAAEKRTHDKYERHAP